MNDDIPAGPGASRLHGSNGISMVWNTSFDTKHPQVRGSNRDHK